MGNPSYRLTGANPLSYMGVEPSTPPQLVINSNVPTNNDSNFNIGSLWVIQSPEQVYMLASLSRGQAVWVQLYPGSSSGASTFVTGSGTAVPAAGVLNVLGDNLINTSGAGNTVTIALDLGLDGQIPIASSAGDTTLNTITAGAGIHIVNGHNTITISTTAATTYDGNSGSATPSSNVLNIVGDTVMTTSVASGNTVTIELTEGTNGQIPIAATSAATIYANITSMDGSVTITNGANTIDLSSSGGATKPSFFLYQGGSMSSRSVPSPYIVYYGQYVVMTKKYDIGTNCTVGDGAGTAATFTAPVTGKYMLGVVAQPANAVSGAISGIKAVINTTGGQYTAGQNYFGNSPTLPQTASMNFSTIADMSSGDTATFGVYYASAGQWNLFYNPPYGSCFWGYLIT